MSSADRPSDHSVSPKRTGVLASIAGAVTLSLLVAVALADGGTRLGSLPVAVLTTLVAFAVNWTVFVPSWLGRTERFYDLTGSITYLGVMAVAALSAQDLGTRATLAAALVALWALRLGTFLFTRILADGHDRRFEQIKQDPLRFLLAWTMQATWVVLTSAAAVAVVTGAPSSTMDASGWSGLLLWVVGFAIEAVADEQKRRFRAAGRPGGFIRSGLWAWSRHPNYFGEILLWVGIAVLALPTLDGWRWLALVSPVFVTVLLTRISGIPMLERSADRRFGDDPDYRSYRASTPTLLLRPPRSR